MIFEVDVFVVVRDVFNEFFEQCFVFRMRRVGLFGIGGCGNGDGSCCSDCGMSG